MRTLGFIVLASFAAALTLSTSCGPQSSSQGSLIGEFHVTGTLQSNACAPGLNPMTPATFTARLSVDHAVSTWAVGSSSATGTASGTIFHVTARSQTQVFTGCVLDQTEVLDGTYTLTPTDSGTPDAGSHSATMTGTSSTTVSTRSGPACLNVLIANGGTFPMLPCTAVFGFVGTTD